MEISEKHKIEKIIANRKKAHRFYSENSPVYNAFIPMEEKTFQAGHLNKMTKELIAIGISIRINCESCLEWHIKQAIDAGAEKEQLIEAIEVGIEMGGGPATVSARFALNVIEYYLEI